MAELWRSELEAWLTLFVKVFRHRARARMCLAFVAGLIGAEDRKSVHPLATPDGAVGFDQFHHFVASGAWDASPLEKALLAEAERMVGGDDASPTVDETVLPKKGEHLVVPEERRAALKKPEIGIEEIDCIIALACASVVPSPIPVKGPAGLSVKS
jgi:SRSO17 transposase